MEISHQDWKSVAKKIYGDKANEWKFKCPSCGNIQSIKSVEEQMGKGMASKRHGMIEKEDIERHIVTDCLSPDCNWVAYGLFNSGILVIFDPDKEYSEPRKENCGYVFPFADLDLRSEAMPEI